MATYQSSYSNDQFLNAINTFYNTRNKIVVTAETGSVVTASCGGTTLSALEDNGTWTFYYTNFGTWTITGTKNQATDTVTLTINELMDYTVSLNIGGTVSSTLNNNTWAIIQAVAQDGTGSTYWSVGDTKTISLYGVVATTAFNNDSYNVFIIGFDHNSVIEGIGITFQLGKNVSTGRNIALMDNYYDSPISSGQECFAMNVLGQGNTGNDYGWKGSWMRNHLCGTSLFNTDGTIIGLFSEDLRKVLKKIVKYTDNVGGATSFSTNVTETDDYVFLLSECELTGEPTYCNVAESNYQNQYDYYVGGNQAKYYPATSTLITYWLRSPYYDGTTFVSFDSSTLQASTAVDSSNSLGLSPCFVVG